METRLFMTIVFCVFQVRRALDLSSSFSSCQSNLDNIKPPTEMDSSIMSIASISDEVTDYSKITVLDDVGPPTLMEEVSGADITLVAHDDKTYTVDGNVPMSPMKKFDNLDDVSTCHDITDVFDESQDPTLTLGSDVADDVLEAEDLPRDSRYSVVFLLKKNLIWFLIEIQALFSI